MGNPAGTRAAARARRRQREAHRLALKIKRVVPVVHQAFFTGIAGSRMARVIESAYRLNPKSVQGKDAGRLQRILERINSTIRAEVMARQPSFERWVSVNARNAEVNAGLALDHYVTLGILTESEVTEQDRLFGDAMARDERDKDFARVVEAADDLWRRLEEMAAPLGREWHSAYQAYTGKESSAGLLAGLPQNVHAVVVRARDEEGVFPFELVLSVFEPPSQRIRAALPELSTSAYNDVPVRIEARPAAQPLGLKHGRRRGWAGLGVFRELGHRIGWPRTPELLGGSSISRDQGDPGTLTFFAADERGTQNGGKETEFLVAANHVLFPPDCDGNQDVCHPKWSPNSSHGRVAVVRGEAMRTGETYIADAAVAELAEGISHRPAVISVGPVVGELRMSGRRGGPGIQAELFGQLTGLCCVRFDGFYRHMRVIVGSKRAPGAHVVLKNQLRFGSEMHPQNGMLRPDHTDSGAPVFVRTGFGGKEIRLVGLLAAGEGDRFDTGGYPWYVVCPARSIESHLGVRLSYQ